MSDSVPYAKVTVSFELEDGSTSTYIIPKARNVVISNRSIPVDLEKKWPLEYLTNSVNLEFTMTADFDESSQRIYVVETKGLGKENH